MAALEYTISQQSLIQIIILKLMRCQPDAPQLNQHSRPITNQISSATNTINKRKLSVSLSKTFHLQQKRPFMQNRQCNSLQTRRQNRNNLNQLRIQTVDERKHSYLCAGTNRPAKVSFSRNSPLSPKLKKPFTLSFNYINKSSAPASHRNPIKSINYINRLHSDIYLSQKNMSNNASNAVTLPSFNGSIENSDIKDVYHHHQIVCIREQDESPQRFALQDRQNIIKQVKTYSCRQNVREEKSVLLVKGKMANGNDKNGMIVKFYKNIRSCQTQKDINLSFNTIQSQVEQDEYSKIDSKYSINFQQTLLKLTKDSKYKDLRQGRLLGVGRYASVYFCHDKSTMCIYAIKELLKEYILQTNSYALLQKISTISHSRIMSIYYIFKTDTKVCLITEYCMRSLYDRLSQQQKLAINQIKKYLLDVIEGVLYLHDHQIVHGNISVFQVFFNYEECKIKPNIVNQSNSNHTINHDLQNIAILAYEMAYGITRFISQKLTLYEKEKTYKNVKEKEVIVSQIKQEFKARPSQHQYLNLNAMILQLLDWQQGQNFTSHFLYSHPFFQQTA